MPLWKWEEVQKMLHEQDLKRSLRSTTQQIYLRQAQRCQFCLKIMARILDLSYSHDWLLTISMTMTKQLRSQNLKPN
jgi:hypothetical protein